MVVQMGQYICDSCSMHPIWMTNLINLLKALDDFVRFNIAKLVQSHHRVVQTGLHIMHVTQLLCTLLFQCCLRFWTISRGEYCTADAKLSRGHVWACSMDPPDK